MSSSRFALLVLLLHIFTEKKNTNVMYRTEPVGMIDRVSKFSLLVNNLLTTEEQGVAVHRKDNGVRRRPFVALL